MNNLYTKFMFKNKALLGRYNEKIVRFIFEQVQFFLEYHDAPEFSNSELTGFVNESAKCENLVLTDQTVLIETIMTFFCDELGMSRSFADYYEEIQLILSAVIPVYISDGSKYLDHLTKRIIEEFNNSSYSTTMDEIISRISVYPELRFLPYALLSEAVNSVYDFFTEAAGR